MAKGNTDLELLIKMMGQTTNDNDNIVLVSIRKANEQVKKLTGGGWAELLRGHFTIAADPFEGLVMPNLDGAGRAPPSPDPMWRRGVHQPPPAPNRPQPPPPPQRPNIRPDMSAGASGPMGTAQTATSSGPPPKRVNRFKAVCFKCSSWVDAGDGILDHQNSQGQWKVRCSSTLKCNQQAAQSAKTKKKSGVKSSIDNLTNML